MRNMTIPQETQIDDLAPPPPRIIADVPPRHVVTKPRPKNIHTKHLTVLDRFRVRTLYYDACLSKERIRQITGYSLGQIRTAVRARSAAVGKRPGRPKNTPKKGKSSNAELPTPGSSDENAELIRQAKHYFENVDPFRPRPDEDEAVYDARESGDEEEEGEDEEDDTLRIVSASVEAALLAQASSATDPAPPEEEVPAPAATQPQRTNFNDLPTEVRVHIWRCVLSTSPTQVAPSRSWALAVLPREPWLELGMSPPHVQLENPPWDHYVEARHVPATVLTRVNREARSTVLQRCTPILISKTVRDSSKGIPPFIWIDRYSDVIHFFGEMFRHELFDMAGRCACPELYR
ncbi:hypothetical protein EV127DRAFT_432105 [Xylaria flabelliformis]|nr:hypothetical protein EV127DRAFT_432105 [Xylaria flabelliformis]